MVVETSSKTYRFIAYRYLLIAIIIWSSIIGISLAWNISIEKKQSVELAINAARANYNKDKAFRLWATKHGGVYVPPTQTTPPNPYLAHLKDRDIVTTDGKKLTLMNPAYMIRQVMDDYTEMFGITGRIVGQVALNPDNLADEFESKAIDAFIAGTTDEVIEQTIYRGKSQIRLVRPFYMEPGCVKCHGHLGFKDKDVRGAIGISIPLEPYVKLGEEGIRDMIISHSIIYMLGLIAIIIISYKSYLNLIARKKASDELHELNQNLDSKVKQRTLELEESLKTLENTQNKLIETEKMSALGSLVAGVAHEINTPLGISITGITHIKSETQGVLKSLNENSLGKNALVEYLNVVDEMSASMYLSLRNAANLIRSFKQVAIDQHTEDKRDFNLNAYFDEFLLSMHNKLKHTKIKVINEIDKNIEINTYAGIFSQAWTNFIMNSLIHGYEDASSEGKIHIKGWIESEHLHLTYEDDGKGIEEKNLQKVFDPFFTTKLGEGGSGLGLNIIYNLIKHKLKGEIYCESHINQGVKMIIIIPMEELINE
ncbi:MAG: DUF3365 domain-containing protein [Sulfurimonas sp.]|nr:DUF3365 domain-containing protein [Sulfurimonas sp.]